MHTAVQSTSTAAPKPSCIYRDSWTADPARGAEGAPTPDAALTRWLQTGHVAGYTDLSGPWNNTYATASAVSFTADHATVAVERLTNGTWLVLSGFRC